MRKIINLELNCLKYFKIVFAILLIFGLSLPAKAVDVKLQALIEQALKANPTIKATEAKIEAAEYRVPQVKSLPDPFVTTSYQNGGWTPNLNKLMSWAMISVGQTVPVAGKLKLRGEVATAEVKSLKAELALLKLNTVSRVKELYFDLFLSYKNIDIIDNNINLFKEVENAAISRYSTGLGQQQDVLLAQAEKYNLLAQKEQWKQKNKSIDASLDYLLGRNSDSTIERPDEPTKVKLTKDVESLIKLSIQNSPELLQKGEIKKQEALKIKLAKKEYYSDITYTAGSAFRGAGYGDMWNVSAKIGLPLYYKTKQRNGVREARARERSASFDFESTKYNLSSRVRDNYAIITASDRLMKIYGYGLISQTEQNFEASLTGYITGENDALVTITTLKNLLEYETLYWEQFIAREKAIARLEAIVGAVDFKAGAL